MRRGDWIVLLMVLGLAALAAVTGHWLRRSDVPACALDGIKIDPAYRVRIVEKQQPAYEFCCPRCAELWLRRQQAMPRELYVTDEASGQELPAAAATFVRSLAVTMRANQNRVHAFRNKADAAEHARIFHGDLLDGPERPFANFSQ